jgi:hypothetical protein
LPQSPAHRVTSAYGRPTTPAATQPDRRRPHVSPYHADDGAERHLTRPGATPHADRRRTLRLFAALTLNPVAAVPLPCRAAAAPSNLRFRALRNGLSIGMHTVSFRQDGERLVVRTRIDVSVKVLLFTAYYLKHESEEVWHDGRLMNVKSTTDDNGTRLEVSGSAVEGGFRIIGEQGPFLAPPQLLTSNMLWDTRMLSATRLIDVQYGGVIGLAVKPLGPALVDTPQGQVRANRHRLITPHYAGTLFHDSSGRWVKGVVEAKGELIE